jgi:hypothetical protein
VLWEMISNNRKKGIELRGFRNKLALFFGSAPSVALCHRWNSK